VSQVPFGHRPIHHVGFVVADLSKAIERWTKTFGAGPFYVLDDVQFEWCRTHGEPARFSHAAAFGQWGSTTVELQRFEGIEPAPLHELLAAGRREGINHVGIVVPDLEAESRRFEQLGYPPYLDAGFGDVHAIWHDTIAELGYSLEVHTQSATLDGFFANVAAAADGWDGSEPIRRV
jgi:catechol 2,3-dioxygenase-like lactoylglutathione lyase family enzyme